VQQEVEQPLVVGKEEEEDGWMEEGSVV